jgi:hypothetical protein
MVDIGGHLGGTGTVGDISCAGYLEPGGSRGCLTSSNLTFTIHGHYVVELADATACSGHDRLIVRGTNNLNTATLDLVSSLPVTVGIGQQFTLLDNDAAEAITGTFAGLPNNTLVALGDIGLRLNYSGGDGNDVLLTVVNAPGAALTLNASDRGWYDSTGHHDPGNVNYIVGENTSGATNEHRNWFVFNVPAYTGTVVQAELLLRCFTNRSPTGAETFVLRQVSTPVGTLVAGGEGLTNIFTDLADGRVYSVRDVLVWESAEKAVVPLNLAFLNQLNPGGGSIALGGSLASMDSTFYNECLFAFSGTPATDLVQLRLTFGSTAIVNATKTGWYNQSGSHNAANDNYLVGESSALYRDFFVFDLPAMSVAPCTAQLYVKPYGIVSPEGLVDLQLRDVATPISNLVASATGATDVFGDLGSGELYGGRKVFVNETPNQISLPLNASFRGAVHALQGAQIALGGALRPEPLSPGERLFSASPPTLVPGDVQLWLGFVPPTVMPSFAVGSPTTLQPGVYQFVLNGATGTTNEIQASSDLENWDAVRTLYQSSAVTSFSYTNQVFPYRYFRARLLP